MKKIKYQGGLTKLIASEIGKGNRRRFSKFVDQSLSSICSQINSEPVHIDVVSFSSKSDFYEQILSILSFVRYVGIPDSWTIYSDGSHTEQQINLLAVPLNFVKIEIFDWSKVEELQKNLKPALLPYKAELLDYASKHAFGKRLCQYLNHRILKPTLFLDSDVLFYKKATVLQLILQQKTNGWYLPETIWGCLDSRYIAQNMPQMYQVNAGFFLIKQELNNYTEGLDFLKSLNFDYQYFSEQTVMHILLQSNGFMPLDPRIFVLSTGDQFDFSYLQERDKMAIRHYTGPVRHKMWQKDWKWQLSLS